jgi:hypothetical protein
MARKGVRSMPNYSDPLTLVMTMLFFFVIILILCVFFLPRLRWWLTRRGFRPSYISLGNAFQQIQATSLPQVEYSLEEQRREKIDEDHGGGPDDPTRYYRRKMKKVDENAAACEPTAESKSGN